MGLTGIDHVNIDTWSIDETVSFYTALGLESRLKPSGNPGVWLYLGDAALVHVNPVETSGASDTGHFNHVAFKAADFEGFCARLDDVEISYDSRTQPELGRAQIVMRDPNGIMVEVTFSI